MILLMAVWLSVYLVGFPVFALTHPQFKKGRR